MKLENSRTLKIIFITGGVIILLAISSFFLLSFWVKHKLVSYLEEHTEYNVHLGFVSIGINSAEVSSIELTPKLDKESYQQANGYQKDWIVSKIERLHVYGINWYDVVFNKKAEIEKVIILQPDIYVYRDNTLPNLYKYKALPAKLLQNFNFPFSINSLDIGKGKIEYEKKDEKGTTASNIVFSNLQASISHIGSDSLFVIANPVMDVNAQAELADSIKIKIEYKVNMLSPSDEFTLKGNIESFNAVLLNQYIAPLSTFEIKSGYVNSIHFNMDADENIAVGKLDMDYRNLKINILSKESPGKKSELKTLLTNIFMRDEDKNEKHQDKPGGEIRFERRKDRFIFNYWWNSVKSGVLSAVNELPMDVKTTPK